MAWSCFLCAFLAFNLAVLVAHFNSSHRQDKAFHVNCKIDGCNKDYVKANSYAKHVRNGHRSRLFALSPSSENCEILQLFDEESPDIDDNDSEMSNNEMDEAGAQQVFADENQQPEYDSDDSVGQSTTCETFIPAEQHSDTGVVMAATADQEAETIHDMAGRFIIKVKEENRLTNTATQNVVASTSRLFYTVVQELKDKVKCCLENSDHVDATDVPGFDDAFDEATFPFRDLMSAWKQEEFSQTHLKYVEPVKKKLGTVRQMAKRKNKKRIVEVEETFYYIPLLKSLQFQLASPKILEFILSGPITSQTPDTLFDFSDGTFVSEHHLLFACDDRAIKLIVYYDDVNIVNPLSNKAHSLGFFYYQIANLPPEYRSKLKSINLLAIAKTKYIKKYGLNKILEPLVDDLKPLGADRGYPFFIDGIGTLNLRGALMLVLADTPASQACGGFKEGVGGARRKCRHCMASFDTMQNQFTEEEFVLRSAEMHKEHIQTLENAPSNYLKNFYSKEYGINCRSILMDAPYFDVCEQLPQDVMHVFLEGILAYHIKRLLHHYITTQNAFSLEQLNKDVEHFPLGYTEKKDRPVIIKSTDLEFKASTNLGQSASKMHLLANMLPFIMGQHIDMDDEHWRCFMSLLDVMTICLSRVVTCTLLIYLRSAIRGYLSSFKELYECRITPKLHYLVHLPSLMFKFGPLVRSWCMRMEAKHSHFKNVARALKNFKNLPYSLAHRYQSMEAADRIQHEDRIDPCAIFDSVQVGGYVKHVVDQGDFNQIKECLQRFYNIQYNYPGGIYVLKSVTVYGTLYKPADNNYLLISTDPPEFGRILKIWDVRDHGIFFVLKVMKTNGFNEDLNAYEIEEESIAQGNEVKTHNDLCFHQVLHSYKFQGMHFITKKDASFETAAD